MEWTWPDKGNTRRIVNDANVTRKDAEDFHAYVVRTLGGFALWARPKIQWIGDRFGIRNETLDQALPMFIKARLQVDLARYEEAAANIREQMARL